MWIVSRRTVKQTCGSRLGSMRNGTVFGDGRLSHKSVHKNRQKEHFQLYFNFCVNLFLFTIHVTYPVTLTITHYKFQSHIARSQSHKCQLKCQKLNSSIWKVWAIAERQEQFIG